MNSGSSISDDTTPLPSPIKFSIMPSKTFFILTIMTTLIFTGSFVYGIQVGKSKGRKAVEAYLNATTTTVGLNGTSDNGKYIRCYSPVIKLFSDPNNQDIVYQDDLIWGANPRSFFVDGTNIDDKIITIKYSKGKLIPDVNYEPSEPAPKVRHWYKLWL